MSSWSRADGRVDGLADDAVHARERADVDDAVGALAVQVDALADAEDHLAQRPVGRQVRPGRLEHLLEDVVRLLVADEVVLERLQQGVLVGLLERCSSRRPPASPGSISVPSRSSRYFCVPVGVPDPLGHVRQPRLAAVRLDLPHGVVVAEGVQPAEDLAHHADQRPALGVPRRHRAEEVPRRRSASRSAPPGGPAWACRASPARISSSSIAFSYASSAAPGCVSYGRVFSSNLRSDVAGDQSPPRRADQVRRVVGHAVVAVLAAGARRSGRPRGPARRAPAAGTGRTARSGRAPRPWA